MVDGHPSNRLDRVGIAPSLSRLNYLLTMAAWRLGLPLATACTLVLKPVDSTPLSTIVLADLVAGIHPTDVVNTLSGRGAPPAMP